MLTVHNFSYGIITPVLGYLMSCLGAFLGLRCTARARACTGRERLRWLMLAALSIGTTGIWVMHFIAMLGYTVRGQVIHYNVLITIASMLIAVVVVGIGLLIVGFGKQNWRTLLLAGTFTGLGVATMHYTGMAALHMFPAGSGGGMNMAGGGATAVGFLLPLLIGISVLAFIMTATIALSPSDVELRADAALMQRIEAARDDAYPPTGPTPTRSHQQWPSQAVSRGTQARRAAGRDKFSPR